MGVRERPEAEASREAISDALLVLLETSSLDKITVAGTCRLAHVSRRTFYRHFATMADVVSYRCDAVVDDLSRRLRSSCGGADRRQVFEAFFAFWGERADLLFVLRDAGLMDVLFTSYIKGMVALTSLSGDDPARAGCRLSYVAGGLWSVLVYWLNRSCVETPDELAAALAG